MTHILGLVSLAERITEGFRANHTACLFGGKGQANLSNNFFRVLCVGPVGSSGSSGLAYVP
jgi:hypothetical protein